MSLMKIKLKSLIRGVIAGLAVPAAFPVVRAVRDQMFLTALGNPDLRPSPVAMPIVYCIRAAAFVARTFRQEFDEYAIRKYSVFVKRHYAKDGRGYYSYETLSDTEKKSLYGTPEGRLRPFIEEYGDLAGYQDGDSFFDAGCGRGQNTKVLLETFPNSSVLAMDYSAEAVSVIDLAAATPRLRTQSADLTDPAVLTSVADNSWDHIVMSHVLSVLLGDGIEATQSLRRRVIGELSRIARKTVLIIDSPSIVSPDTRFEIEQRDRGSLTGSILPICDTLPVQTVTVSHGASVSVLLRIKRETTAAD